MSTTREYRMVRRGAAVAATRERILAATIALGYEELDLDPTLERVAARAGVSVQTVLRRFGSRTALLDEALAAAQGAVADERLPAAAGDDPLVPLLEHYRLRGAFSLRMLAREDTDARAALVTAGGKRLHRDWVSTAFGPRLSLHDAGRLEALMDLLVVATDVYAWKLLALERGLPDTVVLDRMRTLVDAILAPH
ncbi:TetR family transcriptional regulator [Amnibacterium sp.]|uniref:TetR family transcriptional regulator n=1 Tax=Amnibacterium sp. TaxID=1872496 RepID=UPI002619199E|nr:TetR family transcriptional regulator [Amnibacterium sp.]MCU1473969.1 TetR/AcrR family transcriptional regulator [Amnibacterium sp.]